MAALGRPRDPELDESAMSAAIALIVESGYRALTMDRIASRAGVSKAALYRRWPNKLELTVDAIGVFASAQIPLPDTGGLRSDLVEMLEAFVRGREAQAATYEALGEALTGDAELGERCRDTLGGRFAAGFRTIVTRAVERGELPADTDIELVADLAPALVRHRRQTKGRRLDDAFIERIAAQFFTPAAGTARCPSGGRS